MSPPRSTAAPETPPLRPSVTPIGSATAGTGRVAPAPGLAAHDREPVAEHAQRGGQGGVVAQRVAGQRQRVSSQLTSDRTEQRVPSAAGHAPHDERRDLSGGEDRRERGYLLALARRHHDRGEIGEVRGRLVTDAIGQAAGTAEADQIPDRGRYAHDLVHARLVGLDDVEQSSGRELFGTGSARRRRWLRAAA